MAIPNNGWIPSPLKKELTQFPLPEVFQVYYYVCNPGPYDPLQPYEKPIIKTLTVNQLIVADAGWKNGTWGWVAGINWIYAYGDALIDAVFTPLDPAPIDESCPNNVILSPFVTPSIPVITAATKNRITLTEDSRFAASIIDESKRAKIINDDIGIAITIIKDDKPA